MSVIIRGMKMPKDCLKCPFCLFADGRWKCLVDGSHADFGGTCRPSLCPLIELPPHGRLIDADALDKQIYNDIPLKVFGNIARMAEMRNIVFNAPTVIGAEEVEE